MENVAETKLRILREAIQSNVEVVRRRQSEAQGVAQTHASCLAVGLFADRKRRVTSRVPSLVGFAGERTGAQCHYVDTTKLPSPVEADVLNAAVPLSTPYRINRAVLPLSVKRIVIDPGHGGKQHGAISESGVSEKDITLDIALRLRRLMENAPFEVLMTRQTDETLPLEKRVAFANTNNADLFVSIHVNWMEPREIRPLETYYVGATNDPAVIKLAGIENRDSGYSLADYRRLLEKIYLDTRRDESYHARQDH